MEDRLAVLQLINIAWFYLLLTGRRDVSLIQAYPCFRCLGVFLVVVTLVVVGVRRECRVLSQLIEICCKFVHIFVVYQIPIAFA